MNVQRSFGNTSEKGPGKLYLVATPIGNLEDMTFRAVRTLREADVIAAEDTRQTRKLLTHFEIQGRLLSYHEHNKAASGPELVRLMVEGQSVALVSDAGMPAISDPGADLARLAIEAGIAVVPIPGANAALSALVMSGLPTDSFTFIGFLPREKKPLHAALADWKQATSTMIFYESPHRIDRTLAALLEVWGDRQIAMVRELTKRFEEAARGSIRECLEWLAEHPPKGEYCIVVEGAHSSALSGDAGSAWWQELTIQEHVAHYEKENGNRKEAMKQAAADRGVSKRDIYRQLLED